MKLKTNTGIFYKLLYHPAVYNETGIMVIEPRLMLGLKNIKKEILFFNIFYDLCLAWQSNTPFTTNKSLKWLESRFKNQLFLLNVNGNSLDEVSFEKKLNEIIAFEM